MRHDLSHALQTDRLSLVQPAPEHVGAMARLANNANIHAMMARLPYPYGEDDARFYIEQIAPGPHEHCFAIMRDGDELIGTVGLHLAGGERPELGYWLGERYWGQGYGTEAARAVVEMARAADYPGLRARALASNAASLNVLRKLGFVDDGEGREPDGATHAGAPALFLQLGFAALAREARPW